MNLKTEYHLHTQEKTWLKARKIDSFAQTSNGESLFYLQELSSGEGRVCFNSQLARSIGLSFIKIQDSFDNAIKENDARFSSSKFKTNSSYFKDDKKNSMVFDDAIKQMFSRRFWTYSSDLQDGKVIDITAAPFSSKENAKALFNLIENNFTNIVNDFQKSFQDINDKLSLLNIGINENKKNETLKDKIKQIKEQQNTIESKIINNHIKNKI